MIKPIRGRVFALALVASLVLSLVPAVPASAVIDPTTIYVNAATGNDVTGDGTEAAPYKSISAAVMSAGSGDTIMVADGTYSPSETAEEFPLEFIETDVTVVGDTWATLDGEGLSEVFVIVGSTVTLEGIAITGGFTDSEGGGLLSTESTVTLSDVEMYGNTADNGGAIFAVGSTLDVEGSALFDNGEHVGVIETVIEPMECEVGGALLALDSEVTLTDSAVYANGALFGGAGIYSVDSTLTATGSSFFGNEVTEGGLAAGSVRSTSAASTYTDAEGVTALNGSMSDGGAIASFMGTVNVTDCGFYENAAYLGSSVLGCDSAVTISKSYFGGDFTDDGVVRAESSIVADSVVLPEAISALAIEPTPSEMVVPSLTADSCVFEYNDALAVFVSRGVAGSISNSLFSNNDTLLYESYGGPLIGLVDTPAFDVINVTTADNTLGHGAVWDNTEDVQVANCIIWDEYAPSEIVPTQIPDAFSVYGCDVTDSDLMSLVDNGVETFAIDADSVISEDPMFADADNGDYRLTSDSPCVDAGSDLEGMAPDHDLEGVDRPLDGDEDGDAAWDMGAFEYLPYASGRIAGENRFETSVAIAEEHFTSADTAVLATGRAFADGLAGSGLAGAYEAPILLTDSRVLPTDVAAELVRLGVSHVVLLGGEDAISADVEAAVAALGDIEIERFGGVDRYETASMIADEIEALAGPAYLTFVARGDVFPDALAASPIAYGNSAPVLLVGPDELPDTTVGYIAAASSAKTVIIGGTDAVSTGVEDGIKIAAVGPVSRITGEDRYDTAAQVAGWAYDWGFADFGFVGVATGEDFADALSGGAAIGARGGVLVLTDPYECPHVTEDVIVGNASDIGTLEVFGGPTAIADDVVDYIMGLLEG